MMGPDCREGETLLNNKRPETTEVARRLCSITRVPSRKVITVSDHLLPDDWIRTNLQQVNRALELMRSVPR
jgi:hypothetical protein